MKKKFLASILVGTIVCSSSTLVFAKEKIDTNNSSDKISTCESSNKNITKDHQSIDTTKDSKVNKETKKSIKNKSVNKETKAKENKDEITTDSNKKEKIVDKNTIKDKKEKIIKEKNNSTISPEDHQELIRAVEEMREAATLLDNSDLTKKSNLERMDKFSKAALARIESISTENLPENFKNNIKFIKEMGEQIEESSHNVNRLLIAINNVETVFNRENETLDNKNNVLDTLNTVITQERESGVLNKATLNSAVTTLQKYATQLPPDDPDSQDKDYYLKEITYAVEEMREAGTLLDNSNLTEKANLERLEKFSKTALTRLENIPIEKLPQNLKDNVKFVKDMGKQIEEHSHNINRLLIAINNVETVFNRENETLDNKNNVLDTLNTVITQERESGVLNKATLNSAITTLQKYAAQLPPDDPDSQDKDYNLKEMTYAVEEMKEAVTLLDNADFTKQSNYERMIRFVTASLDRARGLDLSKDKELLAHYEWIEESGDSIRNATKNITNLNSVLKNTEKVFNPTSHSTEEQMNVALTALENIINKEEELGVLNKTTLNSARTQLDNYSKNIPTKPSDSTKASDSIKPSDTDKPSDSTKSNDTSKSSTSTKESESMKTNVPVNTNKLPRTGGNSASSLAGLGILSALVGVFLKK